MTLRYGAFAPQGWKLEYNGTNAADAWAHTKAVAAARRTARIRPPLGVRPLRDRADPRAHTRVRSVHDPRRTGAAHRDDQARPARHVRRVPQRGIARQGSRVCRRVLRGPAHLRARRGVVRPRVPGVRDPVPERGHPPADPRGDARGREAALDRGDGHATRASTSRSTARTATRNRSSSCPRSGSVAAARR